MAISTSPFIKTLFGFSGGIQASKAWETGKPLMDRLWDTIRANKLATTGINYWFYQPKGKLFVGVELNQVPPGSLDLERNELRFEKYASWKHKGRFSEIPTGYRVLQEEIMKSEQTETGRSLEIYGHVKPGDPDSEMEVLIEVR